MSAVILTQIQRLEQVAEDLRSTKALLCSEMGDAIEDCSLPEVVALLVSQRENARNAHAATQGKLDAMNSLIDEADKLVRFYGIDHPAKPWPAFRAALAEARGK